MPLSRCASWLLVSACSLALAACPKNEPKGDAEKPAAKPEPAAPAKPAKPALDPAAGGPVATGKSCLGAFKATGETKTFDIAGKSYQLNGDVLSLKSADADDEFIVGQISDIKEDTPENLENVKQLLAWVATEKADALVVTGDLAEGQPAIEHVMASVATFNGPVFLFIGNREGLTDFEKAFTAVAPKYPNLVNMNHVRLFNADDISLMSLPGYYNPAYVHSQDGCVYTGEDVQKLATLVKEATGTQVLVAHGPPRMDGVTGLDRINEGANVGDPNLARYLAEKPIPFGLFGNIHESGGKATDLSGKNVLKPDTYLDSLYLNPGPADAVRWLLLDGTESAGMGGLLHVKGKQALYKVHRLRPVDAKPATP